MLALSVMMALFERERTGRGRWVHTSLMESLLFMMDFQATRWLVDKEVPQRVGNEHPTAIPTDVFPTRTATSRSARPARACGRGCALSSGHPEWAKQAEWTTRDGRRVHKDAIHASISRGDTHPQHAALDRDAQRRKCDLRADLHDGPGVRGRAGSAPRHGAAHGAPQAGGHPRAGLAHELRRVHAPRASAAPRPMAARTRTPSSASLDTARRQAACEWRVLKQFRGRDS
jgi:hypothetical protein